MAHRAHQALVRLRDVGVAQKLLRARARRRLGALVEGAVTVVIASWNAPDMLEVGLRAVRAFADRETRLIVVDNHSATAPRDLTAAYGARLVRLPFNTGHSMALDVGFLLAGTQYVMSLDVDAFPYSPGWMPTYLDPLAEGFTVAGNDWYRHYAHPCCLAMETARFVRAGHSFRADGARGTDVGEAISLAEGPERVKIIEKSGNLAGSGFVSASYGDVLYHNAYGTRHLRLRDPGTETLDATAAWETTRADALKLWAEALDRFGPSTWPVARP